MPLQEFLDNDDLSSTTTRMEQAWAGPNATPARLAYRGPMVCWILRILQGHGGMPVYCDAGTPRMGLVADVLKVPALADPGYRPQDVQQALAAAFDLAHSMIPDEGLTPTQPQTQTLSVQDCAMLHTIHWLADSAGLDDVEREIFEFAAAMRAFRPLRLALSTWGELGIGDLPQAFSSVLNRSLESVAPAFQSSSRLLGCGLVTLYAHGDIALERLIKVPRVLGQRIPMHEGRPELILSHLVVPLVVPSLRLADFDYMQSSTQLAHSWLVGALQDAASNARQPPTRRGSHLLVNGAPGLGKTEWVRALLSECAALTTGGCMKALTAPTTLTTVNAMELVVLDADGAALSGEDRLNHLRLALNLLRSIPGGVIVFDEADDVFRAGGDANASGSDSSAVSMANHRASLNRLIEDSRVPVIWIMNHPEILDPAVLRRFDTVIAFESMPRSVRLTMLRKRLGTTGDGVELARWADIATLTPALIDRLAVVVERADRAGHPMDLNDCRHWLRSRLPGKSTSRLKRPAVAPWDATAVHASEDLLAIAAGIGRCGSARLLLYGAPGTGKTAFAHALARMLDKPLQERRASDLLSPWVGETEQRINQAFEDALQEDAVLFIDEVDSLLASREHAVRNWEVSQVNELLEQLSDFEGIVVLATNRLQALDEAVLRRMDAKIRFEVLNPEQLRESFVRLCAQIDVVPTGQHLAWTANLKGLTPGDFACVRRRLAFAPPLCEVDIDADVDVAIQIDIAKAVLDLLREELRLKGKGTQPIGFYNSEEPPGNGDQAAMLAVLALL